MNTKVTLIIKTFDRPTCINKLVYSIRTRYPNVPIIVADDGKQPAKIRGTKHLRMSYDSGVSAGRNLALNHVDTPFVVTLDDDFVFSEKTKLEKWLQILEDNPEIDIVGGDVIGGHPQYHSSLHIENNALIFKQEPRGHIGKFELWDIVLQFWMGRTDKIKSLGGWDERFKTCDHIPFFCRALGKLNIVHTTNVAIDHAPINNQNYFNHRNKRMQYYLNVLMDDLNIKRVIDRNGNIIYTRDGNTLR